MKTRPVIISAAAAGAWVLPVVAQESGTAPDDASGLATFITFLPLILLLIIFAYVFTYFRKANARAKRCEEHMDRVEVLLERVADAVEKKK